MEIPTVVAVIWWATLILTTLLIVPLAVYLLHRTLRAAREIEHYAARALEAGAGIAANTGDVRALDATISSASGIVETARAIEEHTGTIERVIASRAERSRP